MRSQEIARRYSAALYQVAAESNEVEAVEQALAEIAQGISDEAEVRRFLAHPLVPREAKSTFLTTAFPSVSEHMANFLDLIIRNRRESYLDLIYDEYVDLRASTEGRLQVTVTTAQPMSDEDEAALRERLTSALKRPVMLGVQTDRSLLGGIRLETAGRVIDGTIRARLEDLRKTLED